jgi:type II secretory pathway predicted ATPase ExeA
MHPNTNPFTPGAGVTPARLVGRDALVEAFSIAVARQSMGRPANGIMVYGLRGTGKTVLLNHFASHAGDHEWIVIQAEAAKNPTTSFLERLSGKLSLHLRRLVKPTASERTKHALGAFKGFTMEVGLDHFGVGIEIDPQYLRPYTGDINLDLPDMLTTVAQALAEDKAGLAVVVDELQDLPRDELSALIMAAHEAAQTNAPFLLCGAGLPSLPRVLSETKSYSERLFDYARLDTLDEESARRVLVEPVEELGESWDPEGLDLMLSSAQRYPYFLQVFGKAAWDTAAYSPIDRDDAMVARSIGFEVLDQGFFLVRWERATKAERRYLRAMAVDGDGPSAVADVAKRRKTSVQALGPTRARLIGKGIVYSPSRGQIQFTVPGMATFIKREDQREL